MKGKYPTPSGGQTPVNPDGDKHPPSDKKYRLPFGLPLGRTALALAVLFLAASLFIRFVALAPSDQNRPDPAQRRALKAPLVYEEPSSLTNPDQGLEMVDDALFQGLRQAGLAPDRVGLSLTREADGEITTLIVMLKPQESPDAVLDSLKKALKKTKADYKTAKRPGEKWLEVSLGGNTSHMVILKSPSAQLPEHKLPQSEPSDKTSPPAVLPPALPPSLPKPSGPKAKVALIIDDIGYQNGQEMKLLELGIPLTLSILPHSHHGKRIAELAYKKGLGVMLHLPMEPKSYPETDPGPGKLLTGMKIEKLRNTTIDNLASVPHITGANNHMGSLFTEDEKALNPVLEVLKEHNLFFVDSLTSPASKALETARRLGIPSIKRDIFLDHDPSPRAVERQVLRLLKLARPGRTLVVIGHPHRSTIKALEHYAGRLKNETELVLVESLLKKTMGRAPSAKASANLNKTAGKTGERKQ